MFTLPSAVQVYLCSEPADMRKSFDSLAAMTTQILKQDPLSGHLFVFFNRNRNRTKILFWDRSGYCIFHKRLEIGTFTISADQGGEIALSELLLVLEGIDLNGAVRKKRFALK